MLRQKKHVRYSAAIFLNVFSKLYNEKSNELFQLAAPFVLQLMIKYSDCFFPSQIIPMNTLE